MALALEDREKYLPGRIGVIQTSPQGTIPQHNAIYIKLDDLLTKVTSLTSENQVLNLKLDEVTTALRQLSRVSSDMSTILTSLATPKPPSFSFGSPPHKITAANRHNMDSATGNNQVGTTFPNLEVFGTSNTSPMTITNQFNS